MSDRKLTVGSLFSGIGGFELGLERTGGFEVKWQVEIDPFCRKVLEKHWPGVRRYEDVRTVGSREWSDRRMDDMVAGGCCDGDYPGIVYHGLEPVDVICGGFPCQDISVAGKGEGLAGARSGLWSEFARLIREIRPRYVVVENVSALLGRGMGRVLGDLAASGYDAEWDCIPAADVGASHFRERLWLVAYPGGQGPQERQVLGGVQGPTGRDDDGQDAALDARRFTEPAVVRAFHGIPNRVDRIRSLGNSIVPQIAEWIGYRILEAEAMNEGSIAKDSAATDARL